MKGHGILVRFGFHSTHLPIHHDDRDDEEFLEKLKEHLKSKLSARKFKSENKFSQQGYNLNFKWETTIGLTGKQSRLDGQFDAPMDVKIDEERGWILVSDCGNRRVSVFDGFSKQFKFNIELYCHPCTIQVVQVMILDGNKNGGGLIVACDDGHVLMIDLDSRKIKWKSCDEYHKLDAYLGSIYVNYELGHVYVGDFNDGGVRVLYLETGNDIKGNTLILNTYWTRFAVGAYGMERLLNNQMVIGNFLKNSVTIVPDFHGALSSKLKSSFNGPRGICVDKTNGNILVCDEGNDKIHIFDKDGKFIKAFGEYGSSVFCGFSGLFSCAINYVSGELIVADTNNYRIQVFR